jgi:hypothetical protein
MSARIAFESIGWEADEPSWEVIDLAAEMQVHVLFANGNYEEARAVGETEDAIAAFRLLMAVSGFPRIVGPPPGQTLLHRPGDELYHVSATSVSVCPVPDLLLGRGSTNPAEPVPAPERAGGK